MRIILSAVLCAVASVAPAQVWEKMLAPGLTYRMEVDASIPRVVHAFRYSLSSPVKARPELSNLVVYTEAGGRETLSDLVKRTGAIGGINGDFFPYTGDPLGLMIKDRQVLSLPFPKRSAFGWSDLGASGVVPTGKLTMKVNGGATVDITGFNQECGVNDLCLNTEAAGVAIAKKGEVVHAVLRVDEGSWTAQGTVVAQVRSLVFDAAQVKVAPGTLVLSGSGPKAKVVSSLQPEQWVSFNLGLSGFSWDRIEQVIGGGPTLVRGGSPVVDWAAQGFDAAFSLKRHSRSAVGATADGDLWFVAVDGRQTISDGATLPELAEIMIKLGCVDAINLDGGGSTTINVRGLTINRPSDGQQRTIANAVLFFADTPTEVKTYSIRLPERLTVGGLGAAQVFDPDGQPVPDRDVVWAAQGKAWIDQGGTLRGLAEGEAWVFAYVKGQLVNAAITVEPAATPSRASLKRDSRKPAPQPKKPSGKGGR
jgi:exopolysaccharide biosynthesis protein